MEKIWLESLLCRTFFLNCGWENLCSIGFVASTWWVNEICSFDSEQVCHMTIMHSYEFCNKFCVLASLNTHCVIAVFIVEAYVVDNREIVVWQQHALSERGKDDAPWHMTFPLCCCCQIAMSLMSSWRCDCFIPWFLLVFKWSMFVILACTLMLVIVYESLFERIVDFTLWSRFWCRSCVLLE